MRSAAREGSGRRSVDEIVNELVASSADAACATSASGKIVAWNRAATDLLGYAEKQAVKTRCWNLLAGLDTYGNPLCGPRCPLVDAVRRRVPVHRLVLNARAAAGHRVRVHTSVLAVTADSGQRVLIHLLHPYRPRDANPGAGDTNSPSEQKRQRRSHRKAAAVLSGRELEVLRLMAAGHSTEQMANELYISILTVRRHIRNILSKLEVHSRLAAVYAARVAGLL